MKRIKLALLNSLLVFTCLAVIASSLGTVRASSRESLSRSVIKITVTSDAPEPWYPWQRSAPTDSAGSGAIIAGDRVLTAAHVIDGAAMIEVTRSDVSERFTAEVEHVSHTSDLAILLVRDSRFFEGAVPLEIGTLPMPQQRIDVHGFPIGGEGLSVTTGIVSRVGVDYYLQSKRRLLLAQVDAAINEGNSGGPAVSDGRIVGIAMQGYSDAENISDIVPAPIISHFLADAQDGTIDGFPELDIRVQELTNESLRKSLGLESNSSGVLVTAVSSTGSTHGILEPGDVLLAVGGTPVAADNSFEIGDGLRVESTVLEHRAQVGDRIAVRYMRNGKTHDAKVAMKKPRSTVPFHDDEGGFPYRIYAGLLFQPLTGRHIDDLENPPSNLTEHFVDSAKVGSQTLLPQAGVVGRSEVVILGTVFRSELTRGYEELEFEVIYSVNGIPITSLRHLSDLIDSAQGEFITFLTEQGYVIAVDRQLAADVGPRVLEQYQIGRSRSADLQTQPAQLGP